MTKEDGDMHTLTSRYMKIVLLFIGGFATINGLYLALTTNMNVGVILTLLLGVGLFSYGIFYMQVNDKFPKWLKTVLLLLLAILLGFISFLFIYGNADNASHEEDIVIVLGASVHGETPGEALQNRLDAAVD